MTSPSVRQVDRLVAGSNHETTPVVEVCVPQAHGRALWFDLTPAQAKHLGLLLRALVT